MYTARRWSCTSIRKFGLSNRMIAFRFCGGACREVKERVEQWPEVNRRSLPVAERSKRAEFFDPPVACHGWRQSTTDRNWRSATSRLRGVAMGWLLTMPGVKRYWLTAARTLASTPAPADLTILRSDGLPVLSTIIAHNDLAVIVEQASGARSNLLRHRLCRSTWERLLQSKYA